MRLNVRLEFLNTAAAAVSATLALVSVGLSATAARAESVADLAVIGRAPTTMTIPYVGRTPQAVRLDVREAAGIVCDAALTNGELEPLDRQWCRDKATARTLRTYAKLRAQYLADAAPLQVRVLASR
ncbi:hypothetical protein [Phenylobacterium sp.]|jgi:hypothetical protein|uniref:hypothetical protein n=1 Tax=Phenylobacterium sp. TaxID=1871053 RepID=UPI000C8D1F76|nr:hypothetical protein [Phenylobacterium sp.]MAK80930.1 hypothetical protein [Phenylobacterium sp.]|tara:strand:+ start:7325 stop:7705 length:381 start_codon:yes stop_codon:yes gene_type:complete